MCDGSAAETLGLILLGAFLMCAVLAAGFVGLVLLGWLGGGGD